MRQQIVPINSGIMLYGLCLIVASLFFTPSQAALNELSPNNTQCACSGDVLTFTCTIVGGGNTIWRGSAFVCPSTTNEIILRHSTFGTTGTSGSCNSGTIVGQSVRVEGTCFTSQLNVTVSESLNSRAVQCDYNSNRGTTNIGSAILNVVSASNPYPPPNDVSLISINQRRQVTFNWTSASSSCTSIDYLITSDCGVCPSSTNSTTVTCSDLQLPTQSDNSVCSFNVSSRVCGIVGNQTTSVLAVPDVLRVLSIVPLYANESQSLKRLTLTIDRNNTRITTNDISGPITEYIVTYSTPSTLVDSTVIPAESLSCEVDICNFIFPVPSSVCLSSSDINFTVSAANRIGQGPSTNIFTTDCTNMFVRVNFNSSSSIFSCEFCNKLDNSVKLCEISYHAVGSVDQRITVQNYTTSGNPYLVTLALGNLESGTNFYYIVTASSNESTDSVRIEGNYITKSAPEKGGLVLIIVLPVVAVLLIVMSVVLIIIILLCYINKKSKNSYQVQASNANLELNTSNYSLKEQLKLHKITGRVFVTFKVTQNCSLREGFENLEPKITSWRGHVFYQLTDEEEDISDDKELILLKIKNKEKADIPDTTEQISKKEESDAPVEDQKPREEDKGDITEKNNSNDTPVDKKQILEKEDTGKLLTPGIDSNELYRMGFKGEWITRSKFGDKYQVFVQSKGSGARHLAKDSFILYEKEQKGIILDEHLPSGQEGLEGQDGQKREVKKLQPLNLQKLEELPHWPVPSEYFVTKQVLDKDGATLKQFRDKLKLKHKKFNTFLEYSKLDQEVDITDILLMNKETGKLYTVQFDRHNIKLEKCAMESKKWRVLVLSKFKNKLSLKKNMWVAYEDPKCVHGIFRVLDVDEDNVRMSEFVKRELGSFEKGKLFYEFNKKEDLICCRKTIRVTEAKLQQSRKVQLHQIELHATIETFYIIPGVPGEEISPPDLKQGNVDFIHSLSQSSRCLKKGTTLLYRTNLKSLEQAQEEVGQESSADPEKSSSESSHNNKDNQGGEGNIEIVQNESQVTHVQGPLPDQNLPNETQGNTDSSQKDKPETQVTSGKIGQN